MLLFPLRRFGTVGVLLALLSAALVAIGVLLASAPRTARAQSTPTRPSGGAADTITFVYVKGSDTLGFERAVQLRDGMWGELAYRGQPRLVWRQHVNADTSAAALDLDVYPAGSTSFTSPIQRVTLRVSSDSAFMDLRGPDGTSRNAQRMPATPGAAWVLNNSMVHIDFLAALAIRKGFSLMPTILAQGGEQIAFGLRHVGDTTSVLVRGTESLFLHDASGLKEASMPTQGLVVRRVSGRAAAQATAPPTYDAPAGAPYTAEEVRIATPAGHALSGTLTRPIGAGRAPVVITISGSGAQDRDETISLVAGFRPFRQIADTLGRRGIAVLRWDDEGVGGSGGNPLTATSADFANDVRAIVTWLRARPDIDGTRIAILGHSEGGMIAPMVAATDPAIRAIVLMAGPAYTGRRILRYQLGGAMNAAAGIVLAPPDSSMAAAQASVDVMAKSSTWTRFFIAHDPLPVARAVKQPVLIMQGETDHQITPEQADSLAATFRAAGNRDVTVRKFPRTNHLFLNDPDGRGSGYTSLKDPYIAATTLGVMADWLATRLR